MDCLLGGTMINNWCARTIQQGQIYPEVLQYLLFIIVQTPKGSIRGVDFCPECETWMSHIVASGGMEGFADNDGWIFLNAGEEEHCFPIFLFQL